MNRIVAIILAAGEAKRMGRSKQLLQHRGKTLLQNAIEQVLTLGIPSLVVLGANSAKIGQSITDYHLMTVENKDWKEGIGSSIRCGVEAAMNLTDNPLGVIITLADQPGITSEHLTLLQENGLTSRKMVATKYGKTLGVPAFFPNRYFEYLTALSGDQGAKSLFMKQSDQVIEVAFEGAALDIDTEQDWQDFIKGG